MKNLEAVGFRHEIGGRYTYGSQLIATCERNLGEKESRCIHIYSTTVEWLISGIANGKKAFVLFDCSKSSGDESICGGFELPSNLQPKLGRQTADRFFLSAESGNLVIRLRKKDCWDEFSRQQLGDTQFEQLF